VVRSPAGSDPASASVRAKEPISSPAASRGRYDFFCSSLPNFAITWPAMPLFVPKSERNAGVVYPNSIASWTSSLMVTPSPPYASGSAYPNNPMSAAWARRSSGMRSSSSICSSRGITDSRTNWRTASRIWRKSSASTRPW